MLLVDAFRLAWDADRPLAEELIAKVSRMPPVPVASCEALAIPTDEIFYSVLVQISNSFEDDKERMEFLVKSFKSARTVFAVPIFGNVLMPIPKQPALNARVVSEFVQMLARVRIDAPSYQHSMVAILHIFQRLYKDYKDEPELRAQLASGFGQFIERRLQTAECPYYTSSSQKEIEYLMLTEEGPKAGIPNIAGNRMERPLPIRSNWPTDFPVAKNDLLLRTIGEKVPALTAPELQDLPEPGDDHPPAPPPPDPQADLAFLDFAATMRFRGDLDGEARFLIVKGLITVWQNQGMTPDEGSRAIRLIHAYLDSETYWGSPRSWWLMAITETCWPTLVSDEAAFKKSACGVRRTIGTRGSPLRPVRMR